MKQKPPFKTLQEWLSWQEGLHHAEIDLALERIKEVYQRLKLPVLAKYVITVAGTNGKGSTVAMLETIYLQAGYQVGSFTSPHLILYNERIKLQAKAVSDDVLCDAFALINQARGDLSLTYFEFNALAAFCIFAQAQLDIVILEVGLGGRLDATNIIDADVSIITSIGLDHQEWLGTSTAAIAREKAGIFRPGKPAICAEAKSFDLLSHIADGVQTILSCVGRDYEYHLEGDHWCFVSADKSYKDLPLPALMGQHQLQNAASVVRAIEYLQSVLPVEKIAIEQGLKKVRMQGRFQVLAGKPTVILDVAHNVAAVEVLCDQLDRMGINQLLIVFGMLKDKDMRAVVELLDQYVAHWFVATLDSPRSFAAEAIVEMIETLNPKAAVDRFDDVCSAYQAALASSDQEGLLLVTGSFLSVSKVLALQ